MNFNWGRDYRYHVLCAVAGIAVGAVYRYHNVWLAFVAAGIIAAVAGWATECKKCLEEMRWK